MTAAEDLYREGRASSMTAERVQRLEQVGFVTDGHAENWETSYQAYAKWPSVQHDNKLAKWAKRQRQNYALGKLSPYRIEKLEAIGFVWSVRERRKQQSNEHAQLRMWMRMQDWQCEH